MKKAARVQTPDFVKLTQELEGKSQHPGVVKSLREYACEKYPLVHQ